MKWWFTKKKNKNMTIDQVKCGDCEKIINTSECVKGTNGKYLCQNCAKTGEKNK